MIIILLWPLPYNIKTKFYSSFNTIYSKSFKSAENIIVSFIRTYCLPGLYYGLEAVDLNVTEINSLDTPVTRAFAKNFKT